MLNKKAIAALAAGATLVSGLAFATPSFAAEPAKKPTAEQCKNAQDNVTKLEQEKTLLEAKVTVAKADYDAAQAVFDNAKTLAGQYKAAVNTYKDAAAKAKAAKDAGKDHGALDDAAEHARKSLADVVTKVKTDDKLKTVAAAFDASDADKAGKLDPNALDATVNADTFAASKDDLNQAKYKVFLKDAELTAAKNALAELGCKTTPAPAPQPGPQPGPQNPVTLPTVVADPTTKDEAINATRLAAMVLQNAENDLAKKNHDYNDVKAAYEKVIRELSAAKANLEKAQHDLDAFLASGVDDSAKETRLTDLRDRAQAHVNRLAAEFTALTLKYNDAKTAAVAAGAAFKAAKAQYKKIYNEAIALGVNPALLPVVATSDPLMPNFADPAGAKELYAEAVSGKFGDAVAAAAKKGQKEAKKGEAKKGAAAPAGAKLDTKAAAAASAAPLSKTGVTVMFTALAASMLAGIGAAVRKFRH